MLSEGRVVANGETREVLTDAELLKAHGLEPPPLVRIFKHMGYKDIPLIMDDVKLSRHSL